MSTIRSTPRIRLGLPKGRMQEGVAALLADAGVPIRTSARGYRPIVGMGAGLEGFEAKMLKPQNIVEMLHAGSRDLGFAGADWVREKGLEGELVQLLDTELNPVRIVAAAPQELLGDEGGLPPRAADETPWVVASEYERLTRAWIEAEGLRATLVHSYGATEVFPPEDADLIVDNSATGSTLRANGLEVVGELMRSSTRLYASAGAMADPARRRAIEDFVLLLRAVLVARCRVMVEVNVCPEDLEGLIAVLPCMREPTIAALHGDSGYAVKAAVPREELPALIPLLKARGGTDIVVSRLAQIVP